MFYFLYPPPRNCLGNWPLPCLSALHSLNDKRVNSDLKILILCHKIFHWYNLILLHTKISAKQSLKKTIIPLKLVRWGKERFTICHSFLSTMMLLLRLSNTTNAQWSSHSLEALVRTSTAMFSLQLQLIDEWTAESALRQVKNIRLQGWSHKYIRGGVFLPKGKKGGFKRPWTRHWEQTL